MISTIQNNLHKVLQAVCIAYNIPESTMTDVCRKREIVETRTMFAYYARAYTNASLNQIGKMINKHHSCVLNYIDNALDRIDLYESYRDKASEIEAILSKFGLKHINNLSKREKTIDTANMLKKAIEERKAKQVKKIELKKVKVGLFGNPIYN